MALALNRDGAACISSADTSLCASGVAMANLREWITRAEAAEAARCADTVTITQLTQKLKAAEAALAETKELGCRVTSALAGANRQLREMREALEFADNLLSTIGVDKSCGHPYFDARAALLPLMKAGD